MSSFLSFANKFVRNVFSKEPYTVLEVRIEDFVHHDIIDRNESIILHSYMGEGRVVNYEIVLHKENQSKIAFSLFRSTVTEDCQLYYLYLKDRLPILVRLFPNLCTTSQLQEICRYIRENPSQNLSHICAYFGYVEYFRKRLQSPTSNTFIESINDQDDDGKTPLQVAIERERLNVIQQILLLSPKMNLIDKNENNILHYAAQTNREIIASICIYINHCNSGIPNSESNNIITIDSDDDVDYETLERLINTRNGNNFTPLYLACVKDKPDCVKELIKNGADVNGASISEPTHLRRDESFDNHSKLISKLNEKDMKNGGTPLHWCKNTEIIDMLVDMNCNLNARNFHGDTALHLMVIRNNLECVLSLLSHGANVNTSGANGNTPLHLAVKTNDISMVQAIIVFDADLDAVNSNGETARHLAATSSLTPSKDVILYMLDAVGAMRCTGRNKGNCSEGCSPDFTYSGVPPDNPSFLRKTKIYDTILIEPIVKAALEKASAPKDEMKDDSSRKKVRLLSLDGGGIRGLILIQMLAYLEAVLQRPVVETFDWLAGTSTGAILALLLASGYSAKQCREIYFRLKDKLFVGYRPYCSDTLERFLQQHLGKERQMSDIVRPRVLVTTTVADRFPPDIKLFRNYPDVNELLNHPHKNDCKPDVKSNEEYVWKVARSSGAAPTYFSSFECFLDGGLVSNNPTLDLLCEVQNQNRAQEILNNQSEVVDIDMVVSVGTGIIPVRPLEPLNFASFVSLTGITNLASNLTTLMKVLTEQSTQADGQVIERAQSWCSMINVPYFRLSPPISEDIQLDESDNVKLVNMLWESMAHLHRNQDTLNNLLILLRSNE
ncbi:hypothetical protein RDWZM_007600 [Blomia tropicalis]|uniref:phospholipase A2 n=1 Tax=Blomia tropicalis TaxID=40697 RepID=A0A9Q0RI51_BLOTA|nr:hypothetical protein RDWZM_007600 [Blomia tropicalis]